MRPSAGWILFLVPLLSACATMKAQGSPPSAAVDAVPPAAYGHAILDTLTSDRYSGRGYDPSHGADRAEAFLVRRFADIGLVPMGIDGYRVPFTFSVAQVSAAGLAVDGHALRLGVDVLPMAGSTSGDGEGSVGESGDAAVLVLRMPTDRTFPLTDSLAAVLTPATRAVVLLAPELPAFGGNRFRATVPVFVVREASWPAGAARARFSLTGQPEMDLHGADVVGAVRGTAVPDSFVVVSAHYDHLGLVRDAFGGPDAMFRGANDNASGTAMLVTLARTIARKPLRYTVVFASMGAEEVGLIGSTALAASPTWPLDRTRFLVNADMMGGGPNVTTFGGSDHPAEFARLQALLAAAGAPASSPRAQRPNSDHWPFVQRGVPAFFVISGGLPQPYHNVGDVPETLDWTAWEMLYTVTDGFLETLTGDASQPR